MDIRKRKLKGYVALSILIIMCLIMASAMTFFMPNNNAKAISESSVARVDELLLSGYENATKNSPIFNLHSLTDLYSKLTGESKADISKVGALGTKDASYFRDKNDGNDIVVKLGGNSWTVTYLTQASGKVILDLWLEDGYSFAKWNNDYDSNTTYPTNMYGISKVRAVDLNNGGEYWKSKNALYDAYEQITTSPFAIFTVPYSSSYTESIRDYIVQPKSIAYQSNENAYGITAPLKTASNNTLSNDAYDIIPAFDAHWYSSTYCYEGKDKYDVWKDDYLWLPSVAEVGSGDGENGIWKVSTNQKSGDWTWLRSGRGHNAQHVYCLESGGVLNASQASAQLAVRPALHLNLSSVAAASALPTPQTKGNTAKYFDDSDHTFELDKIDEEFVNVTITATGINGEKIDNIPAYSVSNNVLSFIPSEVGEYTVNVTPNSSYNWLGGGKETKSYKYRLKQRVTPVELDVDNTENIIYIGEDQYLPLKYYDDDLVNVVVNKTDNAIEKDGAYFIKVKDAKTYTVDLALKNKNLLDWLDTGDNKDKNNHISVTVKPKTLSITSNGAWTTSVRKSDTTYMLSCAGICEADKGNLQFEGYYTEPNSSDQKRVIVAPTLNEDNTQITVTLPRVETIGNGYSYMLKLSASNALSKNYVLEFSKNFDVEKEYLEISAEDIQWVWTNSDLYGGATQYVADPSNTFTVGVYNGKEYRFEVQTKYTDKNIYPTISTQISEVDRAINATDGEYIVKFEITTINDSIDLRGETTFTLRWKIDRAKYDLSRLVWSKKDSSRVEYDKKNHEIVLTIPSDYAKLKENQSGDWKQMNAGKYTAKVSTFNNTDTNYKTPIKDDLTSYDGSFLWDYPWEINAKKINLTWENEPTMLAKDKAGKDFAYYVVNGEHADKIGSYKYY
ncbi:MAG: hypothetical protein K2K24_04255, partial [Clostridia bacterium]|nr:hypothetical protein [Clostridia bacterium]